MIDDSADEGSSDTSSLQQEVLSESGPAEHQHTASSSGSDEEELPSPGGSGHRRKPVLPDIVTFTLQHEQLEPQIGGSSSALERPLVLGFPSGSGAVGCADSCQLLSAYLDLDAEDPVPEPGKRMRLATAVHEHLKLAELHVERTKEELQHTFLSLAPAAQVQAADELWGLMDQLDFDLDGAVAAAEAAAAAAAGQSQDAAVTSPKAAKAAANAAAAAALTQRQEDEKSLAQLRGLRELLQVQGQRVGHLSSELQLVCEGPVGGETPQPAYRIVASEAEQDWVGLSMPPEAAAPRLEWAVGEFDRASGTLRLLPVVAPPIRMEPRLHSIDYRISDTTTLNSDARDVKIASSKRLTGSFGSTRRKRQRDLAADAVVRVDRLGTVEDQRALQALLSKASAKAEAEGTATEELLEAMNAHHLNIPAHNPDATTAEGAFPLHLMLGDSEVVDALQRVADRLMATAAASEHELEAAKELMHPYVHSRVKALLRASDKASAAGAARYLALAHACLMVLKDRKLGVHMGDYKEQGKRWGLPQRLAQWLVDTFYEPLDEGSGKPPYYSRSAAHTKQLQMHGLVAALLAEGGPGMQPADFLVLATCLGLSNKDLADQFRYFGAVCAPVPYLSPLFVDPITNVPKKLVSYNVKLLPPRDGLLLGSGVQTLKAALPQMAFKRPTVQGRR